MILLLAACLGVANLVNLDVTDSVDGVLARVTKASGQKFVVDPEIGVINVYVRVKDIGLDEFERRLASLTRATWTEKAGIFILQRTWAQDRKISEERAAALAPQLEVQLARLKPGMGDQDFQREARALAQA